MDLDSFGREFPHYGWIALCRNGSHNETKNKYPIKIEWATLVKSKFLESKKNQQSREVQIYPIEEESSSKKLTKTILDDDIRIKEAEESWCMS